MKNIYDCTHDFSWELLVNWSTTEVCLTILPWMWIALIERSTNFVTGNWNKSLKRIPSKALHSSTRLMFAECKIEVIYTFRMQNSIRKSRGKIIKWGSVKCSNRSSGARCVAYLLYNANLPSFAIKSRSTWLALSPFGPCTPFEWSLMILH